MQVWALVFIFAWVLTLCPQPALAGAATPPPPTQTHLSPHGQFGNPMFGDKPSLALRELVFFGVLFSCAALYLLSAMRPRFWHKGGESDGGFSHRAPEAEKPPPFHETWRIDLGVFAFYMILAVAVTFPAVLHLNSHVIGDNESDVWKHLWGFWWVKESLFKHHVFPLHTSLINAPYGGSLFCIDPLNALLSVPLQTILPLTVTFNLIVLFQLALGALAAYLLVVYLTGSRAAALPAGAVYAFSPYIMSYGVCSGVTEALNVAWMPLTVMYWLRTVRESSWSNAWRLAIFLFLAIFSSFYYAAFLMVLLAAMSFGGAVTWLYRWACDASARHAGSTTRARAIVCRLLSAVTMAAAMAFLPVYSFFYTLDQPDSIIPRYVRERATVSDEYIAFNRQNYASLASYVTVGKENLATTFTADRLSRSAYLGFVVLFWFVVGLRCRPRANSEMPSCGWARTSALLAGLFVLLSLGPFLVIDSALHLTRPLSPPYLILYKLVPLFRSIAIPYRMVVLVYLFVAVTMSFGLRQVMHGRPPWTQYLLGITVCTQILVEFALVSPAPYPAPLAEAHVPAVYRTLHASSERDAVLDLPVTRWATELTPGEYFLWQTTHHQRVPYTISGTFYQSLLGNRFTALLCSPHFTAKGATRRSAALDWLRANGFRHVIVHTLMMTAADAHRLTVLLDRVLGPPQIEDAADALKVYSPSPSN